MGRCPHDPLSVKLEDNPDGGVGCRVLRAKIQDPTLGTVLPIIEIFSGLDVEAIGVFRMDRVGHRGQCLLGEG